MGSNFSFLMLFRHTIAVARMDELCCEQTTKAYTADLTFILLMWRIG
jgi:hypothetical protein